MLFMTRNINHKKNANPYSSNNKDDQILFGIASIASIARITVSSMSTSIPSSISTSICYTLVYTGGSNISTLEKASIRTSISVIDMSSISTVDEVRVAVARSSRITRGCCIAMSSRSSIAGSISSITGSISTSICYTLVDTGGSDISTLEKATIRTCISIIDMASISTVDEVRVAVARSSRITRGG